MTGFLSGGGWKGSGCGRGIDGSNGEICSGARASTGGGSGSDGGGASTGGESRGAVNVRGGGGGGGAASATTFGSGNGLAISTGGDSVRIICGARTSSFGPETS